MSTNEIFKFFDRLLGKTLLIFYFSGYLKRRFVKKKQVKNIGVIKLSAFGDVLNICYPLAQLKSSQRNVKISLITTSRSSPSFFSKIDIFDEIVVLGMFSMAWLVVRSIFISTYDIIIDFDQYYKSSEAIALTSSFSVGFKSSIKGKFFTSAVEYDHFEHERYNFHNLVKAKFPHLQKRNMPRKIFLEVNSVDILKKLNLEKSKKTIVVYPGSSKTAIFRRLNIDKYLYLIEKFIETNNVIIAGGVDESEFVDLINNKGLKKYNFINCFSLHQWATIFKDYTDLFIGNDAGLLHLADSQGVPCLGFYGPNIFNKWGGLTEGSFGFDLGFSCSPCIKNGMGLIPTDCKIGGSPCMDGFVMDIVFKKCQDTLNEYIKKKY